ncbi:uncharacterized protein HaLaN_04183, partial [Haematococcus lacustris]
MNLAGTAQLLHDAQAVAGAAEAALAETGPHPPVRLKGRGWEGQPVLRIAKDKLRYGVVVSTEAQGSRLLVAVKPGPTSLLYPTRVNDYAFYRALVEYVERK